MGIVVQWNSTYPGGGVDDTTTNFPTLTDNVHDVMASHVNELAAAVIELETAVGTLGGLRIREQDGVPTVVPVHTITISNGTVTDLGSGEVLLTIASTSVATSIRSGEGIYTVPSGVAVGDVVRITGNNAADVASNVDSANGLGVIGIVSAKPTSTTATIAYSGELTMPSAIVAGTVYYLGTSGGLITTPLDPVANMGSGVIHKRIGIGISATKLLIGLEPDLIL